MNSDAFVFVGLLGLLVIWLIATLRNRLMSPRRRSPLEQWASKAGGQGASLLAKNGYEVIGGKIRIPLRIAVDGEIMQSRLYLDYLVRRDDECFAVKVSKERRAFRWSGSGIRDQLLVYQLIDASIDGVIFLDMEQERLRTVRFEWEGER